MAQNFSDASAGLGGSGDGSSIITDADLAALQQLRDTFREMADAARQVSLGQNQNIGGGGGGGGQLSGFSFGSQSQPDGTDAIRDTIDRAAAQDSAAFGALTQSLSDIAQLLADREEARSRELSDLREAMDRLASQLSISRSD